HGQVRPQRAVVRMAGGLSAHPGAGDDAVVARAVALAARTAGRSATLAQRRRPAGGRGRAVPGALGAAAAAGVLPGEVAAAVVPASAVRAPGAPGRGATSQGTTAVAAVAVAGRLGRRAAGAQAGRECLAHAQGRVAVGGCDPG